MILMWSPVPSAVKYVVYRGGKKETETNAFQAVLPLPVKEGDHEFYVVGVDASGAEGTAGPKYVYSVVKMEPPKSITALVREDGIFLRWDKSAGAMIYNVYRKSPKDKDFKLIGSTQELSLRDGAIEKDVDYLYHVTAKNVTGIESDKSEQVTAKLEEAAAAAPGGEEGFKLIPIRTELVWEAFDITKPFDVVFLGDLMVVAAPGQGNSAAYFVDMDGNVVAKFTDKEAQNPQYTGVSVSSDGTAYVVDRTNAILYELDSSGMPLRKVKLKAEGTKEQITPFDSIEIGGEIFVSDQRNNKILVYGKNGNFLRMFGEHGREEGQFISPTFLAAEGNNLAVLDGGNSRIQLYKPDTGGFISQFGQRGGNVGQFMRATGLSIFQDHIYIGDSVTGSIQKFDAEGTPVGAMSNEQGDGAIKTKPTGLDVRGDLLVIAVSIGNRIQLYRMLK